MRSLLRSITALGAFFFAAVAIAGCGGGIPGNAVAQIHGTPITKATMGHWMKIAGASLTASTGGEEAKTVLPDPPHYKACIAHLEETQPKPAKGQSKPTASQLKSECEQQYEELKQQALGFLISAVWVEGQAEEMKITLPDKAVQKQLASEKKAEVPKESEFQKLLKRTNQTVSDLLLRTKLDMLQTKIEEKVGKQAKKPVSKAEANKYYSQHESQYGEPERRNLNIILTKTESAASSAKSEIEGGQSFASVAKRVSIDPSTKNKGGALPDVAKGQEEKALDEAAFSAKTNVLSGPVKTPFGYYVFEVTKVIPATKQAFSKVESSIKQQLESERQHDAMEKFVKGFKKRWTARTECRTGFVVQDCKGYKAPKTPATPTTPSPSTSTSTTSSATTSAASSGKSSKSK